MKKLIALITTAIISASMVSSCGKAGNSSSGHKWQNSDTLNEWQIDLLESQGLPTDIEQLTPSQKRSIQHIYEMITYLNEKYDEEFVYAGYVEPGVMDEETLYAYPKQYGAEGGKNTVEVTLDDNGDFTDTYSNMDVSSYCEKLIGDYVRSYFDSDEIGYLMFVNTNRINSMKEIECENFHWNIGVQNVFHFSEDAITPEDLVKFAPEFAKFLYKHKIISDNKLNIVKDIDIRNLTHANYRKNFKYENLVYFYDIGINNKSVVISKSTKNQSEYYSLEEYINTEMK